MSMEIKVYWINDYDRGLERARAEEKPMLLDFFKDG